MIVEKLPVKREWEFYDDDDVVVTFGMKENGVAISLAGTTPFAQIRTDRNETSTLVSQATISVVSDTIIATFSRADLAGRVGSTVYGDIRLITVDSKRITLLSFSAALLSSISRPV